MLWLRSELRKARANGDIVIIASHVPILPGACADSCLLWNYKEVLDALHTDGKGVVAAVLTGHDHNGGLKRDKQGIWHLTMERYGPVCIIPSIFHVNLIFFFFSLSPLRCDPAEDEASFFTVEVWTDSLRLNGVVRRKDLYPRALSLDHLCTDSAC